MIAVGIVSRYVVCIGTVGAVVIVAAGPVIAPVIVRPVIYTVTGTEDQSDDHHDYDKDYHQCDNTDNEGPGIVPALRIVVDGITAVPVIALIYRRGGRVGRTQTYVVISAQPVAECVENMSSTLGIVSRKEIVRQILIEHIAYHA